MAQLRIVLFLIDELALKLADFVAKLHYFGASLRTIIVSSDCAIRVTTRSALCLYQFSLQLKAVVDQLGHLALVFFQIALCQPLQIQLGVSVGICSLLTILDNNFCHFKILL